MDLKNFFAELKRRKVYRVAVAYTVVGWLLIQVTTQVFPFLEIPAWAVRLVIMLLALGFPVAVILAWAYELTPAGIKRTPEMAEAGPRMNSPPSSVASEKSIAVLPFENLSDDRENAYFADGIQDDILSSLAKIADLKVISRTSVRQYKTGTRNLREIGVALGVAHILEGSVRRSGNRMRVNAQLINAQTDLHVWGDTFDRELHDLFTLQSELAEQITAALRANLSPREKASLQIHPTADLDAYNLFLRARALFRWSGAGDPQESGEEALRLIEQAVARDPDFAPAHALASRLHSELYWFGYDKTRARLSLARDAAERALRLRPDLGDAHLALGVYYYYGFRDYDLASAELAMAQRATPNDADILDMAGMIERRRARWDDSISNLEKARQLDPRNASVIWNTAETYASLRRYAEAGRAFGDGRAVNPQAHFFFLAQAALALPREGETAPLRAALQAIPRDFDPGGAVTTVALRLSLMERNYAEAARLLAATPNERFNDNGLSGNAAALDGNVVPKSWYQGLVARGLGEMEAARHAFEAARRVVEADLLPSPDDAKTLAMLGLIDAALGHKEEALRAGRRAVEILSISKDAFDGPILATTLAVIYAQVGEPELALAQLSALLALPNGPTPGTLRIEPEWEPLRSDDRFQKLAAM